MNTKTKIKIILLKNNIKQYQVAKKLKLSDGGLSLMMRDCTPDKEQKIMQAINEILEERGCEGCYEL